MRYRSNIANNELGYHDKWNQKLQKDQDGEEQQNDQRQGWIAPGSSFRMEGGGTLAHAY